MMCPKSYDYHYNENYRPGRKTSALNVGSICDDVVSAILLGKTQTPHEDIRLAVIEAEKDMVEFYDHDFDPDIIDMDMWTETAKIAGWKGDDLTSAIKSYLKDQSSLSEGQAKLLNAICWNSLEIKMRYMIDSFIKWVLPKIDIVHDVQKHLETDNDGKPIHGYLDFTCTMKDGKKVLFDLKTSKMPYASDSVLKSPQLALYSHIDDYEYAGYIVLVKILNKNKVKTCKPCKETVLGGNTKNCPKCKKPMDVVSSPSSFSQMLIDKVPKRNKELTMKAMSDTIDGIRAKHFPRNLNTCSYVYGKPCQYYDRCWKGKK